MKKLSIRLIRAILVLKFDQFTHRQIANAVDCSPKVVDLYAARAEQVNITAPELEKISDSSLQAQLFSPSNTPRLINYIQPEMEHVHHEVKVKNAPLEKVWNENLDTYKQDLKPNQRLYRYRSFLSTV